MKVTWKKNIIDEFGSEIDIVTKFKMKVVVPVTGSILDDDIF